MPAALGDIDWTAAQAAVGANSARASELVRNVKQPEAPALGEWNVAQLATHLSHTLAGISAMANGGGNLLDDLWDLGTLMKVMVGGDSELDLKEIADNIDSNAAGLLEAMAAGGAADDKRAWLVKGMQVGMSTLTCHALNELLVHGYDLAKAEGVPWTIDRRDAALVVCGFLFPSIAGLGRAMVAQEEAGNLKATLEIRVRGGGRAFFNFDHGDLSVTAEPAGRVDCVLSVDPVAFLLVAWGRISQWQAIPKGQLLAWGRKPWLALKLRSMLRNP